MWLLGSPRSGSTWLLQMLRDHGSVIPINEPLIGFYFGAFLADTPGLHAAGLDASNCMIRQVRAQEHGHFFAEEFSDIWGPALARFMLARFHAHAQRYPARVPLRRAMVVVKEPNGSQSADLIARTLPRSRLLFLLRDGRDVVDSEIASVANDSWVSRAFPGVKGVAGPDRLEFLINSSYKWLWRTEVVQAAFASHSGPKHLVRYEDLRDDPIAQLKSIFGWLDLEVTDEALVDVVQRHSFERLPDDMRGPREFARSASPGAWRVNLSQEEKEAVHRVIGPKLLELGYEEPEP